MESESQEVEEGSRPFVCPECRWDTMDPAEMGKHLERHRPMTGPEWQTCRRCKGTGRRLSGKLSGKRCRSCSGQGRKLLTKPCPMGCGRHLRVGTGTRKNHHSVESNSHRINCDGSPPFEKHRKIG